jgi:hypothetical protein
MNRRMMIIFVDASHADDVANILEACEVIGYSEVDGIRGKGATGRKLGSRAFRHVRRMRGRPHPPTRSPP